MGKVIKGPWTYKRIQSVSVVGLSGGYKIANWFESVERQEAAYHANYYMVLYVLNNDYNTTFLLPGNKEEADYQIKYREENPDELQKIKNSFSMYL